MTSDNRQISMEKKAYVQNVKKKIVNYPDDAERKWETKRNKDREKGL